MTLRNVSLRLVRHLIVSQSFFLQLSKLSDHIPPDDWKVEGRYDERLQQIWAQWLLVEKEIKSRPTMNGAKPRINGPCLPWYKPIKKKLFSQCMAYLTLQESNIYVKRGGHTSNVVKTEDGHLSSSCWDLVRMSQTDEIYFDSLRMDLDPIAYKKDCKPTDIYAEEHWDAIMIQQYNLIKLVIDLSTKTLLLSQRVLTDITKHLGMDAMNKYLSDDKLYSLSDSQLVTVSHAENITNQGYRNSRTLDMGTKWDRMMTRVRASGGVDIPCTSAANMTNIVEGSEEHLLLLARDEAIIAGIRESYRNGEGTFQRDAVQRLWDEFGIDDVPASDAQSYLQLMYSYGGENELQLWAQRELKKLFIPCDDPTVAMSIYQRHLFDVGSNSLVKNAKAQLEADGINTSDMTSKAILFKYESRKFDDGSNSLVKNAKAKLEADGINTSDMTSNAILSKYKRREYDDGRNGLVKNAKAKLEAKGIDTTDMTPSMINIRNLSKGRIIITSNSQFVERAVAIGGGKYECTFESLSGKTDTMKLFKGESKIFHVKGGFEIQTKDILKRLKAGETVPIPPATTKHCGVTKTFRGCSIRMIK